MSSHEVEETSPPEAPSVDEWFKLKNDLRALPQTYAHGKVLAAQVQNMWTWIDSNFSWSMKGNALLELFEAVLFSLSKDQSTGYWTDGYPDMGMCIQKHLNKIANAGWRDTWWKVVEKTYKPGNELGKLLKTVLPYNPNPSVYYKFDLFDKTTFAGKPNTVEEFEVANLIHAGHDPSSICDYFTEDGQALRLKANPNDRFRGPKLVFFGCEPAAQGLSHQYDYLLSSKVSNRYGPFVFVVDAEAAFSAFLLQGQKYYEYSLGLRKFRREFSRTTLFTDCKMTGFNLSGDDNGERTARGPYKFRASAKAGNKFDHPEYAFAPSCEELEMKVDGNAVKLRFVDHGQQAKDVLCVRAGLNCPGYTAESARQMVIDRLYASFGPEGFKWDIFEVSVTEAEFNNAKAVREKTAALLKEDKAKGLEAEANLKESEASRLEKMDNKIPRDKKNAKLAREEADKAREEADKAREEADKAAHEEAEKAAREEDEKAGENEAEVEDGPSPE